MPTDKLFWLSNAHAPLGGGPFFRSSPLFWVKNIAGLMLVAGLPWLISCTGKSSDPSGSVAKASPGVFVPIDSQVAPMDSGSCVVLADGKVLIAGGMSGVFPTASADIFDPATNTFTPAGSMALPRWGFGMTLLPSGQVLVTGGVTPTQIVAEAERYDPTTETFSPVGSMTVARAGHVSILLPDGKVLIAGGYNDQTQQTELQSAELYDPDAGTFSALGPMISSGAGGSAVLLCNEQVIIAGRYVQGGTPVVPEFFDPTMGTFSNAPSLNSPAFPSAPVLLENGMVLYAGGADPDASAESGAIAVATAERYDPISGAFTTVGAMSTPRDGGSTTLLPNGQVLVAGGDQGPDLSIILASAERFDPSTMTFIPAGDMTTARYGQASALLPNGKVLIVGGKGSEGDLGTAELFDPQDPAPGYPYLSYNPPVRAFPAGAAITPVAPLGSGATSFAINPTLPPGLAFDTTTGAVTGTPTTPGSSQCFTVTVTNGTNTFSTFLWITVLP